MRKMQEKNFWHEIRDHLPEVHWVRIESGMTGAGIPDVNGCWKGREAWIELKVHPNKPTALQTNWIRLRREARGVVVVATRHAGCIVLDDGMQQSSFAMPFNWSDIRRFIFGAA